VAVTRVQPRPAYAWAGLGDRVRNWKPGKPEHTPYRGEAITRTTRGSDLAGAFGVPDPSSQRLCSPVGAAPGDANGSEEHTSRRRRLGPPPVLAGERAVDATAFRVAGLFARVPGVEPSWGNGRRFNPGLN
jgi:hypothetical protein